jgi:hypothetical protein
MGNQWLLKRKCTLFEKSGAASMNVFPRLVQACVHCGDGDTLGRLCVAVWAAAYADAMVTSQPSLLQWDRFTRVLDTVELLQCGWAVTRAVLTLPYPSHETAVKLALAYCSHRDTPQGGTLMDRVLQKTYLEALRRRDVPILLKYQPLAHYSPLSMSAPNVGDDAVKLRAWCDVLLICSHCAHEDLAALLHLVPRVDPLLAQWPAIVDVTVAALGSGTLGRTPHWAALLCRLAHCLCSNHHHAAGRKLYTALASFVKCCVAHSSGPSVLEANVDAENIVRAAYIVRFFDHVLECAWDDQQQACGLLLLDSLVCVMNSTLGTAIKQRENTADGLCIVIQKATNWVLEDGALDGAPSHVHDVMSALCTLMYGDRGIAKGPACSEVFMKGPCWYPSLLLSYGTARMWRAARAPGGALSWAHIMAFVTPQVRDAFARWCVARVVWLS